MARAVPVGHTSSSLDPCIPYDSQSRGGVYIPKRSSPMDAASSADRVGCSRVVPSFLCVIRSIRAVSDEWWGDAGRTTVVI